MHAENYNPSSHHILLVEDHAGVLDATRLLLKSAGYRVTTATSVTEAIERARDSPDLDLLITDYHLEGSGTGKKVISSVREMRGPTFKAIVITADTGSAVHGLDGDPGLCWLRKPVDTAQILTLLKRLLS